MKSSIALFPESSLYVLPVSSPNKLSIAPSYPVVIYGAYEHLQCHFRDNMPSMPLTESSDTTVKYSSKKLDKGSILEILARI